jgi:hypothetical protein
VTPAAQAVDVRPGEDLVGLHLVVLVGRVPLAGSVALDARHVLAEVAAPDVLVLDVHVA